MNNLCQQYYSLKMGAEIIPGLLESIHKATSERKEYDKGKKVARMSGAKVVGGSPVFQA